MGYGFITTVVRRSQFAGGEQAAAKAIAGSEDCPVAELLALEGGRTDGCGQSWLTQKGSGNDL